MFDFPIYTRDVATYGERLYSLLFFGLVFAFYYKRYILNILTNKKSIGIILSILIFSIYAPHNGDFFHYSWIVRSTDDIESFGQEVFYYYLIKIVDQNYFLFRTIVWGGALFVIYQILKRFKLNIHIALFFLFSVFILIFNYARASLGMAFYFWGLSFLLISNKHKILEKVIGIILILLAPQFHRSMWIIDFFTLSLFLKINKKTISIIILFLALTLPLINITFQRIINVLIHLEYNEDLSNKVIDAVEQGTRSSQNYSLIGFIGYYWQYLVFYIIFIFDTIFIFKNKNIDRHILKLYNVTFFIIVFSTLMFIFSNIGGYQLFYRFLYMSFIPLTIMTSYLYCQGYMSLKYFRFLLLFGAGFIIYSWGSYLIRFI